MKLLNTLIEIAVAIFIVFHLKDIGRLVNWLMTVKITA